MRNISRHLNFEDASQVVVGASPFHLISRFTNPFKKQSSLA